MSKTELVREYYKFGSFHLDVPERLLLRDGEPMLLPPKAFDVLILLVANYGHILRKDDLLKAVWPDTIVEENNLSQYVSTLRKTLGDDPKGQRYIETVPKLGYRFATGLIEELEGEKGRSKEWKGDRSPVRSIAVLPFKYLGVEQTDEYLGMGIADAIITKLGNLKQILVRPTSSMHKYTGLNQNPVMAGRELRVESVLEGMIQKRGHKLRVTVQLVSVRDETPLWTDKFDVKFSDIFAVEDSISEQVAKALILKLTREERESLSKRYTENIEAYQLYLKGRYYWNKRSSGGLKKSSSYFQRAIDKDPLYALAYAGLADCYNLYSYYGELPPKESFPKAKAAAAKAIEIDDNLAEAHTSLAFVKAWHDWDWPGAEREFKRSIELNPGYATTHHWYAIYLMALGRNDEAFEQIRRAREIDPLSLAISRDLGLLNYFDTPRSHQAVEQFLETIDMDPGFWPAHRHLGLAYEQKGMYKEAIAEMNQALALGGDEARILAELGHTYAVSGRREDAEKVISELTAQSAQKYVSPYGIALIYVGLDKKDMAFEWLQKAYMERSDWMIYLKVEPMLDSLRLDRRFTDLLQRIGLTA